jgi:hypothetical protein
MKLIVKCTTPELSPDDIEWAVVTLDAPLLERALARRRMLREAKAHDDQLYEMYYWDTTQTSLAYIRTPIAANPLMRRKHH